MLGILFSKSVVLALKSAFLTRPLVSGFFSIVFNTVFLAKLLLSGILFSISVILAL